MGICSYVYLGAYVNVPKQFRELVHKELKCGTCNSIKGQLDVFCSKCGARIVETIKTENKKWSANQFLYHVIELYNLDEDALAVYDPENYSDYDGYIYYPNCARTHTRQISIDVEEDGVYPIPSETEIELAKKSLLIDFEKEINCMKEVVGDGVKINYGLLRYIT